MSDPVTRLSPEEKLLLSLCRLNFTAEQKEETGKLMKEITDWDRFARLVNEHGITALATCNIRENGLADLVPAQAIKLLDNGRTQTMIRNTWLVQRWKEVNTILSDAGYRHVLLKGMALEHTVYGAKGLRQMTDNDILLRKEDALKAWHLLQKHGFVPEMIKSPLHRKIITETGKHLPTLIKNGYAVEIHHRLFHEAEKNAKLDDAISKAVEIDIDGVTAYILNDAIHLDYLKEHIEYHQVSGGNQLRLYLDMELLKPASAPPFQAGFLINPGQTRSARQRRDAYRALFFSLPVRIRLRFLAGDIFPSLKWMKKRHGCKTFKAILLYPGRLGKVLWLLQT